MSTHYFVTRVLHASYIKSINGSFIRNSHFVKFFSNALPVKIVEIPLPSSTTNFGFSCENDNVAIKQFSNVIIIIFFISYNFYIEKPKLKVKQQSPTSAIGEASGHPKFQIQTNISHTIQMLSNCFINP